MSGMHLNRRIVFCISLALAATGVRSGPARAADASGGVAARFSQVEHREVAGRVTEHADVSRDRAEALLATADAGLYFPEQRRLRLLSLLLPGQTKATFGKEGSVATVAEFLETIDEEFPGLRDQRQGPYLLKVPVTRSDIAPVAPAAAAAKPDVRAAYVAGTVFAESFDAGLGNWVLSDSTNGAYRWTTTNCAARSGFYSADAVRGGTSGPYLGCAGLYPNGISTQMTHAQCEDVLGAPQAWLELYLQLNSENGVDTVDFMYPNPSSPGQYAGYAISGSTGATWLKVVFNLRQFYLSGDLTRNPCNQLTLFFETDATVSTGYGARIDDLKVRTDTPPATCSILASALSGPVPLTVNFAANVSGFAGALQYSWSFGDGTSSTSPTPSKTFFGTGNYEVLVSIYDGVANYCLQNVTVRAGTAVTPVATIPQIDTSGCGSPPVPPPCPSGCNCTVPDQAHPECGPVKIFTSVTDQAGSPIQGLTSSNFVVSEDGVPQSISAKPVSGAGTSLFAAINIDNSGSLTTTDFQSEKTAAKEFVDLMASSDQIAVYGFSSSVTLVRDFTADKNLAKSAIDAYAYNGGLTALYDSLYLSLQNTSTKLGRKVVIAMTDGEDTASGHTQSDVVSLATSLGIPVYTIGFGSANAAILQQIASQTGGKYYASASAANLQNILVSIGNIINSQYEVRYWPTFLDSSSHSVTLNVSYASQYTSAVKTRPACPRPNIVTPCTPGSTVLCIDNNSGDRRFEVKVNWSTVQGGGQGGTGKAIATSSLGVARGGLFWFFGADNPEMLVKVLNGCGVNGHFWFFSSAGTNVGMSTTVRDAQTGVSRLYTNPDLTAAFPVQDTSAFTCP